ncbi:MAG: hypothetical protein HEP80_01065 [Dolichospermum sp. UKL201]|nr:MAG: hypothetical protein HEP80_01065 [Dolichospermum sp. UKL201]
MITTNFQKWGALVASLASILTLSSAAEAITFTVAESGPNPTAASGLYSITSRTTRSTFTKADAFSTNPLEISSFHSVTIKNLVLSGFKGRLSATLRALDGNGDILSAANLFNTFTGTGASSSLNGDYTFTSIIPSSGVLRTWESATNTPSVTDSGTHPPSNSTYYASADNLSFAFNGMPLDGTNWRLDLTNSAGGRTGSFDSFSIDAAVPFESNAAPAGVAIVFGALMLRRKLQQRSAQKMSLESVNS